MGGGGDGSERVRMRVGMGGGRVLGKSENVNNVRLHQSGG